MKNIFITFCILIYSCWGQAQNYNFHINQADSLYEIKQYVESAEAFEKAFLYKDGKAYFDDRYNAACSYSLYNNQTKAFYHLFYLTKYADYDFLIGIKVDEDFKNLHQSTDWKKLISKLDSLRHEVEKNYNWKWVKNFKEIYKTDQEGRRRIDIVREKYGHQSKEMKELWKEINYYDSINTVYVTQFLDTNGWLSSNIIGEDGSSSMFLVIQHAALDVQLKYLPMMREAVKVGNAKSYELALLEDRTQLRQGKPQIYGSQVMCDQEPYVCYFQALIDPENVDKRRAEVNLPPISEYAKHFGFEWNLDEYKKMLPELLKKLSEN